jgi:starch synthase
MYSQRYGTPPVAHRTGGLADTITDATPAALAGGTATGFFFERADHEALAAALKRALGLFRSDRTRWRALQRRGMRHDFGWRRAASAYAAVYEAAIEDRRLRAAK